MSLSCKRIYMIFILLSVVAHSVWSQETGILPAVADSLLPGENQRNEVQTRACVSTFENQTVSSQRSVLGCSTLTTRNITVTSSGNLTLTASENITLNPTFEVRAGGTLYVYCEKPKQMIFTYDASGNRIRRQVATMGTLMATGSEGEKLHSDEKINLVKE